MAKRLQAMGQPRYSGGFEVRVHEDLLSVPLRWRAPRRIFVNSMSDLFHPAVPDEFIQRAFDVMGKAGAHVFQVLTKRADRLADLAPYLAWPANVWMGVTVESAAYLDRVRLLRRVPAAVRFLSVEPLLGPIPQLPLRGIDWVIVGGESGPGARPMEADWVRSIRNQCLNRRVLFFFKQWGGPWQANLGRTLDGVIWDQVPMRK